MSGWNGATVANSVTLGSYKSTKRTGCVSSQSRSVLLIHTWAQLDASWQSVHAGRSTCRSRLAKFQSMYGYDTYLVGRGEPLKRINRWFKAKDQVIVTDKATFKNKDCSRDRRRRKLPSGWPEMSISIIDLGHFGVESRDSYEFVIIWRRKWPICPIA